MGRSNRLALDPKEYVELLKRVFRRDRYKCRACSQRDNLHGHHLIYRSHGGDDSMENMATICMNCHDAIHVHRTLVVESHQPDQPMNGNGPLKFIWRIEIGQQ